MLMKGQQPRFLRLSPRAAVQYKFSGGKQPVLTVEREDFRNADRVPVGISCGTLDLENNQKIKSLPCHLQIDSSLIVDGCTSLEALPPNLKVFSLSARRCTSLRSLPECLVAANVNFNDCTRLDCWPEQAWISGVLQLRNCRELQGFPPWMTSLNGLDLTGCSQIHEIPPHLEVRRWIDIAGTGITRLPDGWENVEILWRGVAIDWRIAFQPETITAEEALDETNTERRRVLIERMGYLRFVQEADAKILDADTDPGGKRELLSIHIWERAPLVGLTCFCPSTQRQYFLRVPPTMETCHQAAAWIAGFSDPDQYHPVVET